MLLLRFFTSLDFLLFELRFLSLIEVLFFTRESLCVYLLLRVSVLRLTSLRLFLSFLMEPLSLRVSCCVSLLLSLTGTLFPGEPSLSTREGPLTGTGLVVCGAAWWTGVGLLGCGLAAGGALIGDGVSVSSSLSRNDAKKDRDKAWEDYEECVYGHEKYYGKNRITNPI